MIRLVRGVNKIRAQPVDCASPRGGGGTMWMVTLVPARVKAAEGAERSFRTRRKGRGQRRGKRRARGRHPREPHPTSARSPTEVKLRPINRFGRTFDYWEEKAKAYVRALRTVYPENLVRTLHHLGGGSYKVPGPKYAVFRGRWLALSDRILRSGGRQIRNDVMCPTFAYLVDKHFHIRLNDYDTRGWLDPTEYWREQLDSWNERDYERYRATRRAVGVRPLNDLGYTPPAGPQVAASGSVRDQANLTQFQRDLLLLTSTLPTSRS